MRACMNRLKKIYYLGQIIHWFYNNSSIYGNFFSSFITPYSHNLPSGKALEPPNREHLLGTDDLGIDLLSQICYGARISLIVGLSTSILAGLGGGEY